MEVTFDKWLYHNHGLTSLRQVRNKQKYINAYETYRENLKEASMSDYERELNAWQTKFAPLTVTALVVIFILAMVFIDS
ncbi:hypothetical protein NHG33_06550 [Aerococcaceae bacterium NML130460]|nr:hypothetical protein [Aerococcaceae bacterium NML130460]